MKRSPTQRVREAAAYWLMRISSDDYGPKERAAFEAWHSECPEHADAFARAKRGLAVVDSHLTDPRLASLGAEVLAETMPLNRLSRSWVSVAAAAILALAVGIVVLLSLQERPGLSPSQVAVKAGIFETAVGERSTVSLADGSTIVLNTASRLKVDFSPDERKVILLSGEALFEVAKDSNRPFVVEAGDRRILALGTTFDVWLDEEKSIRVTLVEGRVSVDEIADQKASPDFDEALLDRNELIPGEQLTVVANEPTIVALADIKRVTSWRDGNLVFRNDPLTIAVKEINRYSTMQLVLADDPRLEEIGISGVFDTGHSASFVLALQTIYPVTAQQVSANRTKLMWQE